MKKLLLVISSFILLASVVLGVNAHPGRTDGAGGHTNRSTGEYHYHHGYSEHSHYDMDGDGVKDCPYNFKDKTNHNSSSGSSNYKANQTTAEPTTNQSNKSSESAFDYETVITIGIAVLLAGFWIAPAFFKK